MTPWYLLLTDLGDRGAETAVRSNRRAALAIRAEIILIARAENDAPLADVQSKFLDAYTVVPFLYGPYAIGHQDYTATFSL